MSKQVNAEDAPNTIAIYIIIIISLGTLIAIFYGLSEYRGWITEKRNAELNAQPFYQREAMEQNQAPLLNINDVKLNEAQQGDFQGL